MRDRLQRRKKKDPDGTPQAAPPPLQPAYFEADQAQASPDSNDEVQADEPIAPEPDFEAGPSGEEIPATEAAGDGEVKSAPEARRRPQGGETGQRGRRRRGGRGRGGTGRERAVAQAFTPAAAKGIVPVLPVEEESPEVDSPAAEEATPAVAAAKVPAVVPVAGPRPPKGIVVLAIGLPGSGKSSWFKRHNLSPLSSDMMRALLFDDVREQRFQDLVFSNLRSMLKARLIAKRPMNYVDATNLTPQERQHWIKLAKDYNYEVHAVFFDVPLDVCLERHQRRDRVVPEDIMRRMAAKLKAPDFSEGFAKITVVRVKKKDETPLA